MNQLLLKIYSVNNKTSYTRHLKRTSLHPVVDFQQQNKILSNKNAVDQKRRRVQVCRREFENPVTVLVFVAEGEVKSI